MRTSWLPLTVVGVFLLRGVGSYISEYGMGWTGYRVVFDLRRDLIDKLLRLPTPYYDTHPAGVVQSKISFDAHQLAAAASGAITNAMRSALTITASFGYLLWINWKLTLLTFIVIPIVARRDSLLQPPAAPHRARHPEPVGLADARARGNDRRPSRRARYSAASPTSAIARWPPRIGCASRCRRSRPRPRRARR